MRNVILALVAGCVPPLPELAPDAATPLSVGETREVELRALRLDVTGLREVVDLERLRALPPGVLDRVWLLDVPLEGLVRHALDGLAGLTVQEARQLPVPAQNMRTLLRTTPDNAVLEGTSLAELVGLSAALGIPPGRALADVLDLEPTEPVIARDLATEVLVELLVGTHPATWFREGPVDATHPDGRWTVPPGHLPVTLGDVVSGFAHLTERFGPIDTPLGLHPGFLTEAGGVSVVADHFALVVKVDVDALPYRGLDLTDATDASVNSTGSQIDTLFPVDDPDWLHLEGLVPEPSISRLTLALTEDDTFHAGGGAREPAPRGASTAWDLPPWSFEHLVAEIAFRGAARVGPHCVERTLGTGTLAFLACVEDDGWSTFETFAGLGSPPAPAYLWDLVLELGQVRLHDGGLAEGDADVAFTLSDVSLGLTAEAISAEARRNIAADATVLRELATVLTENGRGAPDVVYVRDDDTDWLWFVAPEDVPIGPDGAPVRAYRYARPGFFADAALAQPVGDVAPDGVHLRVPARPGDAWFVEDDDGAVFRLDVGPKPSRSRIAVALTRLR